MEKKKSQESQQQGETLEEKIPKFTLMQRRQEIVDFIVNNQTGALVVNVPTGGGKTYGLPYIIKEDVIPLLPESRIVMTEASRVVTGDVCGNLKTSVLHEPVGLRIGRDKGANYHGERFTVGTVGASFAVVRKGGWSVVVLDEFDLDQNGDMAMMHNQVHHMLERAKDNGERLVVVLPSATPDLVNAQKFYGDLPFKVVEVEDRIYDPDILEVDLGSSNASSFRDILPRYTETLIRLCGEGVEVDGKKYQIPEGKNILCTIPSPMYFEELEQGILKGVDSQKVEVVTVWGRSTQAEKDLLMSGGTPGIITIFLVTDLIRRGGTPDVYAVFPSGWQVRPFCDQQTGIEGTREERASQADYSQDEGRASRKEKGLVVRSVDSKRPKVGLTFLERNPLENFLLNLIYYEDLREFKWWGDVEQEKIDKAVEELKKAGAVQETVDGRIQLSSLGKAMRGIPGSLKMRQMTFSAHQQGILEQFLVISAGMAAGGLFANAKDRPEIAESQTSLLCNNSDYLSVLRVWGKISEELISSGLERVIYRADSQVDKKKRKAQDQLLFKYGNRNPKKLTSFQKEELEERLALIEMGRQEQIERAILVFAKGIFGRVAFDNGLYKRDLEAFVQNVIQSVSFLNGKTFSLNGNGRQRIELDLMKILTNSFEHSEEIVSDQIHKVILGGYIDQLWENVPHRGDTGYFYRNLANSQSEIGIFPGSATFNNRKEFLVGTPVNLKGKKFLKNVVMLNKEQIAKWLPEIAPQLCKSEVDNVRYDFTEDKMFGTSHLRFRDRGLAEHKVEVSDERAVPVFAMALSGSDIDLPCVDHNKAVKEQSRQLRVRSGGAMEKIFDSDEKNLYERIFMDKGIISTQSLQLAVKSGKINPDDLLLKLEDFILVEEQEKIMADNPDTAEVEGETLTVEYGGGEGWSSEFYCRTEVAEEFVRAVGIEAITLPGGRIVELRCEGHRAKSFSELVEKLEQARIERAWSEKRSEIESSSWIKNPKEVFLLLPKILTAVEITQKDNGQGEPIFGYLSLKADSYPNFIVGIKKSEEEAKNETRIALEWLFQKATRKEREISSEEPWDNSELREALKNCLDALLKGHYENLTLKNVQEQVELIKTEIETAKAEIGGQHTEAQQLIGKTEAEVNAKVEAVDNEFVKSEISQVYEALDKAKISLKNAAYEDMKVICEMVIDIADQFVELNKVRSAEKYEAEATHEEVSDSLYSLERDYDDFLDATSDERTEAKWISEAISDAFSNREYKVVLEKVEKARMLIALIRKRHAQKEETNPSDPVVALLQGRKIQLGL